MSINRKKLPFWRRTKPQKRYDIALLRPATLPKGQRFETEQDVRYESERSELLLRSYAGHSRQLARTLCACREGDVICDQPCCPICALRSTDSAAADSSADCSAAGRHFVRRLHSYYDGVRLLVPVHHRLRLLAFPMRTAVLYERNSTTTARHETSQLPMRSLCT